MANIDFLAAVENYGSTEGDYAQFEESTFDDMKNRGIIRSDLTWEKVKNDRRQYDYVVESYWNDLTNSFGIPEDDRTKALWWLMPGRYKQTGGDISKLSNPKHRNIMENRVKNLDASLNRGE